MTIIELEPFISAQTLVLAEMLLVFGGIIWFGMSQIRAVKRNRKSRD